MQRGGEVDLAAHCGIGDARHLVEMTRVRREELDHLALDECRVDVHDDETFGAAGETGRLHRDVDLQIGSHEGERRAQLLWISTRHDQLDTGDGIRGQPLDVVDVGAGRGDAIGDAGNGARAQWGTEHRDVQAAPAPHGARRPDLGLHVEPEVSSDELDPGAQLGRVQDGRVRRGSEEQHAEREATVEHDLLEVGDGDVERGQRGEQL